MDWTGVVSQLNLPYKITPDPKPQNSTAQKLMRILRQSTFYCYCKRRHEHDLATYLSSAPESESESESESEKLGHYRRDENEAERKTLP